MTDDPTQPRDVLADPAVLEARLKRLARHRARAALTPSVADARPQGSGPANRHGMPRLPPGQAEVHKWPVLDLGVHPPVTTQNWQLVVDGAVAHPLKLDWRALHALPQVEDTSDFHCVTAWSKMDLQWRGVRVSTVLELAEPLENATHLLCHGLDGYTTNVALEEALKDDVLLAFSVQGQALPHEHGGPVRMITPQLYAWKGAKWISRIEVLTGDQPGFWEQRGYSNTAYPWRNDRHG
jgi:DMSO/TMAO reductase YedYZ molybdopterin-dependent catalytic subunit